MADLLGFTSIALVSLFTIFIALRLPDISRILYVALSLRILIIIIGHYFVPLPDSTKDAAGFESLAWTYGQDGFLSAIGHFPEKIRYFWMKNTHISLDIIFLDEKYNILGYIENTKPLSERSANKPSPSVVWP